MTFPRKTSTKKTAQSPAKTPFFQKPQTSKKVGKRRAKAAVKAMYGPNC